MCWIMSVAEAFIIAGLGYALFGALRNLDYADDRIDELEEMLKRISDPEAMEAAEEALKNKASGVVVDFGDQKR